MRVTPRSSTIRPPVGVTWWSVAGVVVAMQSSPFWLACASPSAIRLVAMVKMAMTSTGATTAQGWVARPSRFSFIIWPQLAAPGSAAKPRKPRAATRPIE